MKFLVLITILAIVPHFVNAGAAHATCTPVDLRPELGAPRDQGNTGWCFAHVAADLLTQKLRSRISATDIALQSALTDEDDVRHLSDGPVSRFLNSPTQASHWRTAREPEMKRFRTKMILSENGVLNVGGNEDFSVALANLKGACLEQNLPEDSVKGPSGLASVPEILAEAKATRCFSTPATRGRDCGEVLHPKGDQDLSPLIDQMSEGLNQVILDWADHKCARRIQTNHVPRTLQVAKDVESLERAYKSGELKRDETRERLRARLDASLTAGRAASIGYSAYDVLPKDGGHDRFADHASVIAARRMTSDGQCQYFVRQSWGLGCKGYKRSVLAGCESETGGMWLRFDQLPTLYSVIDVP